MTFETPQLDDRSFDDLVAEARRRIILYCPEWTDHNLSDPGITLVELFAWMTDIVLYRLNRVPDKHFVKFMELIGMRLQEAEPARAPITFWLTLPQQANVTIPNGTEVSTTRTEHEPAIAFSTDGLAEIYVPNLIHALTSTGTANETRGFTEHDLDALQKGGDPFPVFQSETPRTGDALYLGFEQNLSSHILGVEMNLFTAEGAGIDPNNPPYVWEALSEDSEQSWVPLEVEFDQTKGLNVSGLVRLYLPPMRPAQRDGRMAYWVRCRLNPGEGVRSYNVSPQITRLRAASWGITVDATNVTTVHDEVLGRSDGSPGQRFYLTHTPVVTRSLKEALVIRYPDGKDEYWTEVSDFSESHPRDFHYTLDSATGEVRLGPALPQRDGSILSYGAIPAKGGMLVMRSYRYGGGIVGNVGRGAVNVLKTAIPYIARVENRRPSQGGLNAEHLDNAKMRVPGYLRTLRRAVTASDYEYLAREAAPGQVGRVYCLQPPQTNQGEVNLLVIPNVPKLQRVIAPESLYLSEEMCDKITAYLDERRLVSTQLNVQAPDYQWVETEIRFHPSAYVDIETVRKAVESRLFEFLNPLIGGPNGDGWPFGRDLFIADIQAVLLTVPGVDFIRSVKLFPVSSAQGQFVRGEEATEIAVVTHGVIVSYRHTVRAE
jgi:predicted phage baseplate assembly protein